MDQPAGEVQAIADLSVGAAAQDLGNAGIDLLAGLVVGASQQHEGLPRLLPFLHHHGGGNSLQQSGYLPLEVQDPAVGPAHRLGRGLLQEVGAELVGLGRASPIRRLPYDVVDGRRCGDRHHLVRRQGSIIDSHLVDQPPETTSGSSPRSDAKGFLVLEGEVQVIHQHLEFLRLAVDVNPDRLGGAGPVVGHHDVVPPIGGQGPLRLDPDGIVQPAHHQVDVDLAFQQGHPVSLFLLQLQGSRDDGAALFALGVDPGSQGETVVEAEVAEVSGIDEALAVETAGLIDLPPGEFRPPVLET